MRMTWPAVCQRLNLTWAVLGLKAARVIAPATAAVPTKRPQAKRIAHLLVGFQTLHPAVYQEEVPNRTSVAIPANRPVNPLRENVPRRIAAAPAANTARPVRAPREAPL